MLKISYSNYECLFLLPILSIVLPFRGGYVVWHIRIHDRPSGLSLLSLHNDLLCYSLDLKSVLLDIRITLLFQFPLA